MSDRTWDVVLSLWRDSGAIQRPLTDDELRMVREVIDRLSFYLEMTAKMRAA